MLALTKTIILRTTLCIDQLIQTAHAVAHEIKRDKRVPDRAQLLDPQAYFAVMKAEAEEEAKKL